VKYTITILSIVYPFEIVAGSAAGPVTTDLSLAGGRACQEEGEEEGESEAAWDWGRAVRRWQRQQRGKEGECSDRLATDGS